MILVVYYRIWGLLDALKWDEVRGKEGGKGGSIFELVAPKKKDFVQYILNHPPIHRPLLYIHIRRKKISALQTNPQKSNTRPPTPHTIRVRRPTATPPLLITAAWLTIVHRALDLPRQILQRFPLRLRDQEGGEEAAEHEEGEDLHDVVEPGRIVGSGGCTSLAKGPQNDLRDDGADFAGCGADAVGCGAVAGREAFAGDDKGGCVGAWRLKLLACLLFDPDAHGARGGQVTYQS